MKRPAAKRRRSSRRGGGGGAPGQGEGRLTSHPTTRAAYTETRRWLLDEHGPICAYCNGTFPPKDMTLDHVTPRRGQSAYDRRDNLVLACKACNAAKADKSIMAFLLGRRDRAVSLYRYGDHLSGMLREMARQLAGDEAETIDAERAAEKLALLAKSRATKHEHHPRSSRKPSENGHSSSNGRYAPDLPGPNGRVRYGSDDDDSPYLDAPRVKRRPIKGEEESPYKD